MKRLLVPLIAVAFLAVAAPANAVWKGEVCKDFAGPDGSGGVHARACLVVDDHDFEDQIRAGLLLTSPGTGRVEFHVSYLKLVKNGLGDVKNAGPFTTTISSGDPRFFVTTWQNNPNGTYHGRARIWACWPTLGGNCGSVVVWNSGNASY